MNGWLWEHSFRLVMVREVIVPWFWIKALKVVLCSRKGYCLGWATVGKHTEIEWRLVKAFIHSFRDPGRVVAGP